VLTLPDRLEVLGLFLWALLVSRPVPEEVLFPGFDRPAAWRVDPEHSAAYLVEHFPVVCPSSF